MDKSESLGVVSGAYSVGRAQLLKWINDLAQLNYTKIEQTASGVFVCHVFDALYPGQLRLEKVKFNARHSYDYVHNYKVLQVCFDRVGMKRQIDVEKLIKGKHQDNLEFIQWVKAYYDAHATESALQYDGRVRREEVMGRAVTRSPGSRTALSDLPSNAVSKQLKKPPEAVARAAPPRAPTRTRQPLYGSQKASKTLLNVPSPQVSKLKEEIQQLKADKQDLQTAFEDAETEREFYFGKLRKVELLCQAASERIEEGSDTIDLLRDTLDQIKLTLYDEEDEPVDNPEQEGYGGEVYDEEGPVHDEDLSNDPDYEDALTPEEVNIRQ